MKKKYLSALLFGALLFASAGTFTSCKDYDDDIDNLQSQVDDIKADLDDLQAQINAGKWITNVSSIDGGFTVTFSDGQSFNIVNGQDGANGADGADGAPGAAGTPGTQITIGEDGYWYFDGEKSDYLAVAGEDGKINVPTIQNGVWYIVNEEGELEATTYKANGATYAVAEANGGFTIYAPNEDGTGMVECYFPGAAGSITEMTLGQTTNHAKAATAYTLDGGSGSVTESDVLISREEFEFDNTRVGSEVSNAKAWMGNKALPNNGDWVYSSPTSVDLRIDPVNVPADDISFTLTNTLNQNLQPFKFSATPSQTSGTPMDSDKVNSRATTGNGLWTLKMQNVVVASNSSNWTTITTAENNGYVYAVNADNAFRSRYELTVKRVKPEVLTQLSINGIDATSETAKTFTCGVNDRGFVNTKDGGQNVTFKTGVNYEVKGAGVQSSAVYDMYLSADASDIEVYGLKFDQDKHTFRIENNPDVSTIPANFDLTVYTVANDGVISKAEIQIQINTEINAPAEYTLIEHNVNKDYKTNYFGIDLAIMKTALGDNLNQWMQNVDLHKSAVVMEWSADGKNFTTSIPDGIQINVVSELLRKDDPNYNPNADDDRNAANYIQVDVDNSAVNGLLLDHTYYIKATFKTADKETLNSITVPVEFHAPKLADLFAVRDAYVVDNVINAYFYDTTGSTAVDLTRYFSAYVSDAKIDFANGNVGETGHNGNWLFELSDNIFGGKSYNVTTLDFDPTSGHEGINAKGQGVNGYGEAVTVEVTKDYFNTDESATASTGWKYTASGDNEYTFQIRLLSPIYEGTVTPVSGDAVTINANDFVNGAEITKGQLVGRDYATNDFYMFDGLDKGLGKEWLNSQIVNVVPGIDADHYIDQSIWEWTVVGVNAKNEKNLIGNILIKGRSISNTTTVKLPIAVTDAWGYVLNTEVPVVITVGEESAE